MVPLPCPPLFQYHCCNVLPGSLVMWLLETLLFEFQGIQAVCVQTTLHKVLVYFGCVWFYYANHLSCFIFDENQEMLLLIEMCKIGLSISVFIVPGPRYHHGYPFCSVTMVVSQILHMQMWMQPYYPVAFGGIHFGCIFKYARSITMLKSLTGCASISALRE